MTSQNRNDKTMATNPKTLRQGFSLESMVQKKKSPPKKSHYPQTGFPAKSPALWFSKSHGLHGFTGGPPWPPPTSCGFHGPKSRTAEVGSASKCRRRRSRCSAWAVTCRGASPSSPKSVRNIGFYWPQAKYTCICIYIYSVNMYRYIERDGWIYNI